MRHTFIIYDNWHTVIGPSRENSEDAYRWCKAHESDYEFHTVPKDSTREWYFENEQDALLFALKWST